MDLQLAAEVAGIDLLIGAHSHTFLYGKAMGEKGPSLDSKDLKGLGGWGRRGEGLPHHHHHHGFERVGGSSPPRI